MTGKIRTTIAASFRFTGDDPDTLVFFAGLGVNSASSCCNTLTKNDQFEKERTVFPSTFAHPQNTEKIRLHYSICFSFTVTGDYKALWEKITKKQTLKLFIAYYNTYDYKWYCQKSYFQTNTCVCWNLVLCWKRIKINKHTFLFALLGLLASYKQKKQLH